MGYTIEYNRICFKEPEIEGGPGAGERNLYLFIQSGCNNVHPRSGSWGLQAYGWNYSVIHKVCEFAGATEGGMIKPNDRNTTPESYLRMYRKVIAEAMPLTKENLQERIGLSGFRFSYIEVKKYEAAAKYVKDQFEKLLAAGWERTTEWNGTNYVFSHPFETMDDFFLYRDTIGYVRGLEGCAPLDAFVKRLAA